MVFEKAKVLKAAEKFLSQGKINAAIKEYRQIVENDEDDLTTLNMLGDRLGLAVPNNQRKKRQALNAWSLLYPHGDAARGGALVQKGIRSARARGRRI